VVKKLYYRFLLTIIVLACAMPFVMRGRDGRPLMALSDLKMPALHVPGKDSMERLVGTVRDNTPLQDNGAVVTVFRWQDDQGIWHFSDDANPDGQSEIIDVRIDHRVSQVNTSTANENQPVKQAGVELDTLLQPGAIPLLNAGKTLEQARNVESLLQQRYQQQEQILSHK
jgi:hypothetical protein